MNVYSLGALEAIAILRAIDQAISRYKAASRVSHFRLNDHTSERLRPALRAKSPQHFSDLQLPRFEDRPTDINCHSARRLSRFVGYIAY